MAPRKKDKLNAETIKESDIESNEESTSSTIDPVKKVGRLLEHQLGLSVVSSETVDHGSQRVTLSI